MKYFKLDELVIMLAAFAASSLVLSLIFMIIHRIFLWYWPMFRSILPKHKQWYVIANISKSACLFGLMCSHQWRISVYNAIIKDEYDNSIALKVIAMIYILTDGVALFMVPKLPQTTKIHHYLSVLLWFIICCWDVPHTVIVKLILIYGAFSTIPYIVNFFLAMRIMYNNKKWLESLAGVALCTYIISCLANWLYHIHWYLNRLYYRELPLTAILYAVVLYYIAQDDVILMSWLWKRYTKNEKRSS